jgi:agmatine deiminase
MIMTSRRNRLPSRRKNGSQRTAGFRYESLEARIAPGSLIDLVGVAAIGSMLQEQHKGARPLSGDWSHTSSPVQANTKRPDLASFPRWNLHSIGDRPDDQGLIRRQGGREIGLTNLKSEPGSKASASMRISRGLDKNGFTQFLFSDASAAGQEWISIARPALTGSSGMAERVSMPGLQSAGATRSLSQLAMSPAWSGTAALEQRNVGFGASTNWQAAASYGLGVNAENKEMAGVFQDNLIAADQPRIPQELRGRYDELFANQSLFPVELSSPNQLREPTTGFVQSPAEYESMRGVLFSYASYPSIVTDMVKELTQNLSTDDIAYVVVNSQSQLNSATSSFLNAGANLNKVQFFVQPMNSVWIRDYGPHFITVDNAMAIVDSHYYPSRPLDNFIPTLVGDNNFNVPTYDIGMYFSGGNFQPGPNRSGFVTALINADNPSGDGFNPALISELHQRYLGVDTLHILPQLPSSVDGTGHIDMWMYLVDRNKVVISEFLPGSNSTAIQITNNAVGYMESLGFQVFRTPAWNSGGVHFTYANAFRVNNRVFVPVYGTSYKPGGNSAYNSRDDQAMQAWQAAAGPDVEIIPIQCSQIISASGAIHCIVKQVPRYTAPAPALNIISPAGGEILTHNIPFKLEWSAIDTNNVNPATIGIYFSYGSRTFYHIATTADTGSYLWTPGPTLARNTWGLLKFVATSSTGKTTEFFSNPVFITSGSPKRYDFSSGAGVDKFVYGLQTSTWSSINGNPFPVTTQLSSADYARLATSNAVGGNSDSNRYIAPVPNPSSNESTHLFTIQLTSARDRLAQLEVLWEGYANFCTQVELYVWDRVLQNWGDGTGLAGMNRYMDNWAGNIDGYLTGAIRSDFSRYVDESGVVKFLVYADRPGVVGSVGQGITTYHDYFSVTVKEIA